MTLIRTCVIPGCKARSEVPSDAYACPDCWRALVRKLADIETYLSIVSAVPTRTGDGGPRPIGFESSPPLRLDVVAMMDPRTEINGSSGSGEDDDVLDEVPNVTADIVGWTRILVEEHPDGLRLPGGLSSATALLRSRCDWICQQVWCDEFAADVARVHIALRQACGDAPPGSVGQCISINTEGECGGDVFPTPDRDGVRCSRCRRRYVGRDLVRLNAAQAAQAAQGAA